MAALAVESGVERRALTGDDGDEEPPPPPHATITDKHQPLRLQMRSNEM